MVEGVLTVAAVLFVLRLAGLPALPAFLLADLLGIAVTARLCGAAASRARRSVVLTLAYSLLVGVLVVLALAVLGVR